MFDVQTISFGMLDTDDLRKFLEAQGHPCRLSGPEPGALGGGMIYELHVL